MKKKTPGLGTKIILSAIIFMGICMMCNMIYLNEETVLIEGTVEHTYMSGAANALRAGGGSIAEVPMCRVVWYDKEGEKVVYGMPDDMNYEVGDTYLLEVYEDTWRIPKKETGELIMVFIIGLIACIVCVLIWRKKFGTRKQNKRLSAIEQRRREAYNLQTHLPVIRCSICNGEQVAGFKDKKTGQFSEVMLIRNEKDLEEFKERYGVEDVVKEY